MSDSRRCILQARQLNKVWVEGARHVEIQLENLSLNVGDFLTITGPSGSGKSTILDMLALVLQPTQGAALMMDDGTGARDLLPLVMGGNESALASIRARAFGYIVQTSELIPFLTVQENCTLQQKISQRGTLGDLMTMADMLEVGGLLGAYPSEISVGQRQRVAILRGLCGAPQVVLADEPTAAQDPHLKDKVVDLLKMVAARGSAVIMVTHDVDLVARHELTEIRNDGMVDGNNWYSRFYDTRVLS